MFESENLSNSGMRVIDELWNGFCFNVVVVVVHVFVIIIVIMTLSFTLKTGMWL